MFSDYKVAGLIKFHDHLLTPVSIQNLNIEFDLLSIFSPSDTTVLLGIVGDKHCRLESAGINSIIPLQLPNSMVPLTRDNLDRLVQSIKRNSDIGMFTDNKFHRYLMNWEHSRKSYMSSELSPSIVQKFAFLKNVLTGIEKPYLPSYVVGNVLNTWQADNTFLFFY